MLREHPEHDAQLLIEEDDSAVIHLGPNPKIRNMSRAYREAKGDVVWIADCNVWLGRHACGRMVDKLLGSSMNADGPGYKFVHHIPVAVDVSDDPQNGLNSNCETYEDLPLLGPGTLPEETSHGQFGGRLDEAFLSSAHAKMYVAINTVAVAPCICGKSSMFRRSHLNALTNEDGSAETKVGSGIDFFSNNICEDHLIGDLLWKAKIPSTVATAGQRWRNHGLVYGDIAFQPIANMSVSNYIARRARWLRVRKYTVLLATLVEPGTESFLCSLYGAFGATTSSYTKDVFGTGWVNLVLLWVVSISLWICVDWKMYRLLQSGATIDDGEETVPSFVKPKRTPRRSFASWVRAWLAREALALPIWTWAIWGGATVVWRDKKLWVGMDMRVHEYDEETTTRLDLNGCTSSRAQSPGKMRQE